MKKLIALTTLLLSPFVWAESIELSTGEVIEGKLVEFPKEVTVESSDGVKKTIPYIGITSIYKTTQPRSYSPFLSKEKKDNKNLPLDKATSEKDAFGEMDTDKGPYGTPTLTFEAWRKAALNDDIEGMANCYVSYRKDDMKKDLKKLPKKTRKEMKNAMIETIFTPNSPYYQGESAIMEVSWSKGLASQTQTLKFSLENNKEWKIVE